MILSTPPTENNPGLRFQKWYYMKINIQLFLESAVQTVCLDTVCTMSLVDWSFLKSLLPNVELMKLKELITVCSIDNATYLYNKFVHLSIYL